MQRIKTRAQFEAAMSGGTVSRTAHFVLHRAPLEAPSEKTPGSETSRSQTLFAVRTEPWLGVVLPKRWAKRAVTRNGIKRQIYNVSALFAARLPHAAHVVRLRTAFGKDEFKSAWSDPLKDAVRTELLQLFSAPAVTPAPTKVTPASSGVAPASSGGARETASVIPAPSGDIPAPSGVIPAKAGNQSPNALASRPRRNDGPKAAA